MSATYYAYARDNIRNFTIRLELRKVTTAATTSGASTWTPRQQIRTSSGAEQDSEVWTFKWQEKVFSQHEEELYSDMRNCSTVLEQKYHRDILALRSAGGRQNRRLFCYVDSDPPPPTAEDRHLMGDGGSLPVTFAARYGPSVRRRRGHRTGAASRLAPERDPVLRNPSEEQRISARINSPPTQVMYIMADLSKMDSQDEDEQLLCEVKVDDNGMLTVSPDFNLDKAPYKVENRHREIFEYRLVHASETISAEDAAKEVNLLSELYSRHTESLAYDVGTCFADPPESEALRVLVLGEIVSAEGFENDDLYVSTHLELPEFWQCKENEPLDTVTQISKTKSSHLCNTAHFNCPVEHELLYSNPILQSDELPKWPRVLIQVASLDYWDRHRVEGCGFLDLPNTPGKYELTVHTWRPCGDIRDKMARFFVGGVAEISDVSYIAKPQGFEGTHLSKYGFRTQSSGSVTLTFNMVHQSSVVQQRQVDALASNTNAFRYKGFKMSVVATLDAYQKAKKNATMAMETT